MSPQGWLASEHQGDKHTRAEMTVIKGFLPLFSAEITEEGEGVNEER